METTIKITWDRPVIIDPLTNDKSSSNYQRYKAKLTGTDQFGNDYESNGIVEDQPMRWILISTADIRQIAKEPIDVFNALGNILRK